EVLLASPHIISVIFSADGYLVKLAILHRMFRVVTNGVLATQFQGNLIQHVVDGVRRRGGGRNEKCLGSAGGCEAVQYRHVRSIHRSARSARGLPASALRRTELWKQFKPGSGQWNLNTAWKHD